MTASMVLMLSLNLAGSPATEYQPTAVEPKAAIEIVRDLNERLKTERARHVREEAVNLRVGPESSKTKLGTYRTRIANIETKTKELTTQIAEYGAMTHRLSTPLISLTKLPKLTRRPEPKTRSRHLPMKGFSGYCSACKAVREKK